LTIQDGAVFQKSHLISSDTAARQRGVKYPALAALIRNAGYQNLTPLQEKIIPRILSGSDLLVETAGAKGRTAAYLIPLLMPQERAGEVRSLILASSPAEVKKVENQYGRFQGTARRIPILAAIGYESNVQRELKQLRDVPDIIVGTPERIIDHIRRGNLSLASVTRLVVTIAEGEFESGFGKDILYIFPKLGKKVQSIFFVPDASIVSGLFQDLPIKPATMTRSDWDRKFVRGSYYEIPVGKERKEAVSELIYALGISECVVLTRNQDEAGEVCDHLLSCGIKARAVPKRETGGNPFESAGVYCGPIQEGRASSRRNAILLHVPASCTQYEDLFAETDRQGGKSPAGLSSGHLPRASGADIPGVQRLIVIVSDDEAESLQQLQEISAGIMKKEEYPGKDAVLGGKIEAIVKRIREDEDPDELNQYRKLIRKHVPLHLRSYFAAYLLKGLKNGGNGNAEKDVQTLFVSIGKNRKVYPKDLVGLFCSTLGIDSQSLGSVKVLDNYSFVDIPTPYAQKAIDELDGKDYRGRKITVNFARKREEKEQS